MVAGDRTTPANKASLADEWAVYIIKLSMAPSLPKKLRFWCFSAYWYCCCYFCNCWPHSFHLCRASPVPTTARRRRPRSCWRRGGDQALDVLYQGPEVREGSKQKTAVPVCYLQAVQAPHQHLQNRHPKSWQWRQSSRLQWPRWDSITLGVVNNTFYHQKLFSLQVFVRWGKKSLFASEKCQVY